MYCDRDVKYIAMTLDIEHITITASVDNYSFLLMAAHPSIYLLLKPLSSNLLTLPSADKKNLCAI